MVRYQFLHTSKLLSCIHTVALNFGQLGLGCEWNEEFGDDLPVLPFSSDFVPQQMGLGKYYSCIVGTNNFNGTIGTKGMICFGINGYVSYFVMMR